MSTVRTWQISDIDGRNPRTVTLEQFKAELAASRSHTTTIMAALKRGDMAGVEAAQKAMRGAKAPFRAITTNED